MKLIRYYSTRASSLYFEGFSILVVLVTWLLRKYRQADETRSCGGTQVNKLIAVSVREVLFGGERGMYVLVCIIITYNRV